MGSTNNKKGVLIGQLQSYCMVCEIVGKNEDVEAHTLKEEHKENLEKCTLFEGCKLESIRKVPKGYQCERCNCFIRSFAKVKIHVSTPSHIKTQPHAVTRQIDLKQTSEGIIAFGCVKIDDLAWQAIVKDTCLVCDTDVGDTKEHLLDNGHSINLIQAPVLKKYYYLYRKVEASVQCLTCNILIPETDLDGHLESSDHESTFATACDGKITKIKVPNYDLNKGLRINNFISPGYTSDKAMCMICNWFIVNDKINDHIRGFHHQSLLKLHNKFVEKKLESQFVIEANKLLEVEAINATSKNGQVTEDSDRKKDNNNDFGNRTNLDPISESSESPELQNAKTKEENIPHAEEITEPESDLNINKDPESELIKDFNDSMELNGNKSAQKPEESPEKEVKPGQKPKPSKAKKNKEKKDNINTSIHNNIVIPKNRKNVPEEAPAPSDEELEMTQALANEFDIKFKPGGATNCNICSIHIGSTYADIHAHIASVKHKKKFFKASKISPNNYDVVRMEDYNKHTLMSYNTVKSCMIINSRFCIDLLSYQVFVNEGGELKCFLCNNTVQDGQQHSQLDLHRRLWGNSLVITSLDMEFVREVKKKCFHCGFCNAIFTDWDTLLEHLMSRSHKRFKLAADRAGGLEMKMLMQNRMEEFVRHLRE